MIHVRESATRQNGVVSQEHQLQNEYGNGPFTRELESEDVMSFAAGIGAGMGAGMGAGIAIGMASGQKKALVQIREYVTAQELTIHDRTGKEISLDTLLAGAVAANQGTNRGWVAAALIVALLTGIALFAAIAYFVFF
jgi:hypothetical protein